jgi:hypothetical protein
MADIDIERKSSSMAWLWWLLGLLLLALLAWWLLSGDEEEVAAVDPIAAPVTPTTTPEPVAQGPLCVAQVLAGPATYIGQRLGTCPMRVVEVVSDRGFWVEENGQRVFVVINESPAGAVAPGVADVEGRVDELPNVNAGETINVTEAMVLDDVQNLAGPIEEQTRQIASQQPWFLVTDGRNITPAVGGATPPAAP